MTEEYCYQALRIVVAQIADSIGWQSIHQNALDTLVDVLRRRLIFLGAQCHDFSELACRTESNLHDLAMVFHMTGFSLHEMKEYVSSVESIPFPHTVPELTQRPFRCWSDHTELSEDLESAHSPLMSEDDGEDSPEEFIPSFLPPFPTEAQQDFSYQPKVVDMENVQQLSPLNQAEYDYLGTQPIISSTETDDKASSVMPSAVASRYMQEGYATLPAEESTESEEAMVDIVTPDNNVLSFQGAWPTLSERRTPPVGRNRLSHKAKDKSKSSKPSSSVPKRKTKGEVKKVGKAKMPSKPPSKLLPSSNKESNKATYLPVFSSVSTKAEVSSFETVESIDSAATPAPPSTTESSPIARRKVDSEKPKKKKKTTNRYEHVHISLLPADNALAESKQGQKLKKKKPSKKKMLTLTVEPSSQAPVVDVPNVVPSEDLSDGFLSVDLSAMQPPSIPTSIPVSIPASIPESICPPMPASLPVSMPPSSSAILLAHHSSTAKKKKKKKKKMKDGESPAKSEKKHKKKHRPKDAFQQTSTASSSLSEQYVTMPQLQQSDVYSEETSGMMSYIPVTSVHQPMPDVAAGPAALIPAMPAVSASPAKKKKKKKRKHLDEDGPDKHSKVGLKKKIRRPQTLSLPSYPDTSHAPGVSPPYQSEEQPQVEPGSAQETLFSSENHPLSTSEDGFSSHDVITTESAWARSELTEHISPTVPQLASSKQAELGVVSETALDSAMIDFAITGNPTNGQSADSTLQPVDSTTSAGVTMANREENVSSSVYFCPMCHLPDDGSVMISCDRCNTDVWYHIKCVGLKEPPGNNQHWYCPPCKKKLKKGKKKHSHQKASQHSHNTSSGQHPHDTSSSHFSSSIISPSIPSSN